MNTKSLAASVCVALALLTASVARAESPNEPGAVKTAVKRKPAKAPAKKSVAKKKAPPVEVAAPAAPVVIPEPLQPDPPKADEPARPAAKTEPSTTSSAATPGADRPQEDREATREAAAKPFSIAPLAGFGSSGLRLGFGVRAGYTFPVGAEGGRGAPKGGIYVGGAFMYHVGYSIEAGPYSSNFSAFYPSVEGGYELRPTDRLSIRPYGGVGMLFAKASVSVAGAGQDAVSMSNDSLAIYPGCAVSYDIPSTSMFAGGDARLLVPVDGVSASFGVFGSAGIRF
ncbi:MAG: hypothetical protein U0270_39325 [Labilithrix sp.]